MKRLVLAALLWAAAGLDATAQVKIEPPRPPLPPDGIQIQPFPQPGGFPFGFQPRSVKVDGDNLVYEQPVSKFIQKEVEQKVKIGDREEVRKVLVPEIVTEMTQMKVPLKEVKAFGADGKAVEADALAKRLAKPTVILYSPMPNPPPADWQKLLRDDALVVYFPQRGGGFLPPPPPPPDFKLPPDVKPPDLKLPDIKPPDIKPPEVKPPKPEKP
jgi:hypothetical protein